MQNNVQFEDQSFSTRSTGSNSPTGIVGYLLKKEIVKSEKQARLALAFVAMVCIFATLLIIIFSNRSGPKASRERQDEVMRITREQQPL
jgi:hypothetical protein